MTAADCLVSVYVRHCVFTAMCVRLCVVFSLVLDGWMDGCTQSCRNKTKKVQLQFYQRKTFEVESKCEVPVTVVHLPVEPSKIKAQ